MNRRVWFQTAGVGGFRRTFDRRSPLAFAVARACVGGYVTLPTCAFERRMARGLAQNSRAARTPPHAFIRTYLPHTRRHGMPPSPPHAHRAARRCCLPRLVVMLAGICRTRTHLAARPFCQPFLCHINRPFLLFCCRFSIFRFVSVISCAAWTSFGWFGCFVAVGLVLRHGIFAFWLDRTDAPQALL